MKLKKPTIRWMNQDLNKKKNLMAQHVQRFIILTNILIDTIGYCDVVIPHKGKCE